MLSLAGAGLLAGAFLTPLAATGLPPLGAEEEAAEAGSLALLSAEAEAGDSSLLLRLGGAVGAAAEVVAAAEQGTSKVRTSSGTQNKDKQ